MRGTVDGSIVAVAITLHDSAKVGGDIMHQKLSISEGAEFDGRVQRVKDTSQLMPMLDAEAISRGLSSNFLEPDLSAVLRCFQETPTLGTLVITPAHSCALGARRLVSASRSSVRAPGGASRLVMRRVVISSVTVVVTLLQGTSLVLNKCRLSLMRVGGPFLGFHAGLRSGSGAARIFALLRSKAPKIAARTRTPPLDWRRPLSASTNWTKSTGGLIA